MGTNYYLYQKPACECWNGQCLPSRRKDGKAIIWVKKQGPKPWYPPVPDGFSEWGECGGKDSGLDDEIVSVLYGDERKIKSFFNIEVLVSRFTGWDKVVAYCIKLNQPKESEPESTHPTIMAYDPVTGEPKPYPSEASQYRAFHGDVAWLYNPYTGDKRDPRDIGSDVFGHGVKT